MTNQFAHYIVKSSMCKLEGKNSTDGLIISTQTGRIDRFIYKNTISLEVNSVKISVLVYSLFFYGFTGKIHYFAVTTAKTPLIPHPFYNGYERSWSGEEQPDRNYRFIWSIIARDA